MSNENDERNNAQNAMLGWLIAPLAILLALLADYGLDFGLVLEMKEMEPYAAIAIAAILGMAPRVMKEMEIIRQGANLSLLYPRRISPACRRYSNLHGFKLHWFDFLYCNVWWIPA